MVDVIDRTSSRQKLTRVMLQKYNAGHVELRFMVG